jgi:hypothetical protein
MQNLKVRGGCVTSCTVNAQFNSTAAAHQKDARNADSADLKRTGAATAYNAYNRHVPSAVSVRQQCRACRVVCCKLTRGPAHESCCHCFPSSPAAFTACPAACSGLQKLQLPQLALPLLLPALLSLLSTPAAVLLLLLMPLLAVVLLLPLMLAVCMRPRRGRALGEAAPRGLLPCQHLAPPAAGLLAAVLPAAAVTGAAQSQTVCRVP